ncbi:MAG: phosphoribosylglycinamide formyltransferase [Oscillospiraceae bacterium]|nr:phosphoribosylglycinamide formyltransferase [Oscillospiraceae bacterium]
MTRIAVLCSGGGSNLQALLDAIDAGRVNGQVRLVLANRSGAFALQRARDRGISAVFVSRKEAGGEAAFNARMLALLRQAEIDLVVLAGYLPMVGPDIVSVYRHRILNIHPALIPAFCGQGMYGHHVHQAALDYGVKLSGATVHFVDEQADHGPIVAQRAVPVLPGDDTQSLAARVLAVEHQLLPESVALFCAGKLRVDGRRVVVVE